MAKMLMGAFSTPEQADQALFELEHFGYTPQEISVISKSDRFDSRGYGGGEQMAKSAAGGAATGGVIGGLAGLLAGVGVIPALAGLFIGGPIVAALGIAGVAAATVSGAVTGVAAGGLVGALVSLGFSKETATAYDATVNDGGVVLGLTGHEDVTEEAMMIMEKHGAHDTNVLDVKEPTETAETTERETLRREPAFGERLDDDDTSLY